MKYFGAFLFLGLLATLSPIILAQDDEEDFSAYTVRLRAYYRACFHENLKEGEVATVYFEVDGKEDLKIDFEILDVSNRQMTFTKDVTFGEHKIDAKAAGRYTFCFRNDQSSDDNKEVTFMVEGVENPSKKKKADTTPALEELDQIASRANILKQQQSYLVKRMQTHSATAASTNTRVVRWSLFETCVLIAVCLWQVYYLKHFFEVKRVV